MDTLSKSNLTNGIKKTAARLGFDLVKITSAKEFLEDKNRALDRLQQGYMDGLPWYTASRVKRGSDPQQLLPGARSIICLGINYFQPTNRCKQTLNENNTGRIANYAQGKDYHKLIKKRMRSFVLEMSSILGKEFSAKWYVDDGPMLDRASANRSGLGWFGKNTNILSPGVGSWTFLGQIITDLDLQNDVPLKKSCGTCIRCIKACPTGAIVGPYVLDNTKCISFQTIENRGPIPRDIRPQMKNWIFGCDICQEVCPVNNNAPETNESEFQRSSLDNINLFDVLRLDEEGFKNKFAGTPIMRTKLSGLKRNACIALGNNKDESSVSELSKCLMEELELVRGHAAWALGQIGGLYVLNILNEARINETDPWVLEEIDLAIRQANKS
ncbi:MAG: tRNA epoxyqueuosine(34) reductase QueG [Chloroflexota bacterium]|nr:tRNA epoxyqueuosine(34) reductase QueG [Chloroflexota bacterium]